MQYLLNTPKVYPIIKINELFIAFWVDFLQSLYSLLCLENKYFVFSWSIVHKKIKHQSNNEGSLQSLKLVALTLVMKVKRKLSHFQTLMVYMAQQTLLVSTTFCISVNDICIIFEIFWWTFQYNIKKFTNNILRKRGTMESRKVTKSIKLKTFIWSW